MIHDTKNVGKPTVLTCRFPTFYGCLLQHLNNDEFKDKLNKRIEEGKTELIKKTNEEIQSANADFQIEISNIIHNYENHVNALIATYSESVDFEYSFNPEINIRNTFSIKKLGGEILALFLGIFSGNAAGWLLVATSVITFIIDAGKNIMGIFDQKYRAAEQRKSADENINKLAASLEGILSKNVKKLEKPIDELTNSIIDSASKNTIQIKEMKKIFINSLDVLNNLDKKF